MTPGKQKINLKGNMIMTTPKITKIESWSPSTVRNVCIKNNLYTDGSNEDYAGLLDFIRENEPSTENLYKAAVNIKEHSCNEDFAFIGTLMSLLAENAVLVSYEVEGEN